MTYSVEKETFYQELTMEELKKALKSAACGKAPVLDGTSSDILKNGGKKMCEALLDLFSRCLLSGTVRQDFCDALIVIRATVQTAETIGEYYYWP